MDTGKIAEKIVRRVAMGDVHRFDGLAGGVSDVYVSEAGYGREGTRAKIGVFSGGNGGEWLNADMPFVWDDRVANKALQAEIERDVAVMAKKFDAEVIRYMKAKGFSIMG